MALMMRAHGDGRAGEDVFAGCVAGFIQRNCGNFFGGLAHAVRGESGGLLVPFLADPGAGFHAVRVALDVLGYDGRGQIDW